MVEEHHDNENRQLWPLYVYEDWMQTCNLAVYEIHTNVTTQQLSYGWLRLMIIIEAILFFFFNFWDRCWWQITSRNIESKQEVGFVIRSRFLVHHVQKSSAIIWRTSTLPFIRECCGLQICEARSIWKASEKVLWCKIKGPTIYFWTVWDSSVKGWKLQRVLL